MVSRRRIRGDGRLHPVGDGHTKDAGRRHRRGTGQRTPEPPPAARGRDSPVQPSEGRILLRSAIPFRVPIREERLRSQGRLLQKAPGHELRLLRPGADRQPHVQGHPGRGCRPHVHQHGHGARPLYLRDARRRIGPHGTRELAARHSQHGLRATDPLEGARHVQRPPTDVDEGAGGDRGDDYRPPGKPVRHEGGQGFRRPGIRGVQVQRPGRRGRQTHLLGHPSLRVTGLPHDVHLYRGHRRDPLVRRSGSRRRQAHRRRTRVLHLLHGSAGNARQDERVDGEHRLPRLLGGAADIRCARRRVACHSEAGRRPPASSCGARRIRERRRQLRRGRGARSATSISRRSRARWSHCSADPAPARAP